MDYLTFNLNFMLHTSSLFYR